MGITSMTGFAREAGSIDGITFSWELKAVNGRGLDVRVRTPPGFDAIGDEARKKVSASASRGTINVTLSLTHAGAGAGQLRVNQEALVSLVRALSGLPLPPGIGPVTMDGLLAVRGVVEVAEEDALTLAARLAEPLLSALDRGIAAFTLARRSEGRALEAILTGHLDRIAELTHAIEVHPARSPEAIRSRLAEQVAMLLEGGHALDPARLHQEAALIATRADVREEIDRLGAHVAAARELIATDGAVGRKLDFLSQEFGREASTLCAKANDVALSRLGLELRAVVDQVREQVQNVE